MKTTAEQFRRLLPTLQHLARFVSCNWTAICKRDGVALEEVHAVVKEACGSPANWDEEYLAKLAGELGVAVPAFKPAGPRPAPVADAKPAAPRVVVHVDKAAAERFARDPKFEAKIVDVVRQARGQARGVRPGKPIKPKFLDVCQRLLADEKLSENKACELAKVGQSSWAYFKKVRLGVGPVDRAKLRALVEGTGVPAAARWSPAAAATAEKPKREGAAAGARRRKVDAEVRALAATIGPPREFDRSIIDQVNGILSSLRIEVTGLRVVDAGDIPF